VNIYTFFFQINFEFGTVIVWKTNRQANRLYSIYCDGRTTLKCGHSRLCKKKKVLSGFPCLRDLCQGNPKHYTCGCNTIIIQHEQQLQQPAGPDDIVNFGISLWPFADNVAIMERTANQIWVLDANISIRCKGTYNLLISTMLIIMSLLSLL
jgi:hypothetical protein